ncbi:hypothetical protein CPZ26_015030 [Raoultella ornithinolytica]|nr:hypothetical protein CU101_02705 [Raoultella ornithinolytica]PJO27244.1 hypothetical protein CPZ26_015030 [Raoultella ornithinolytica]
MQQSLPVHGVPVRLEQVLQEEVMVLKTSNVQLAQVVQKMNRCWFILAMLAIANPRERKHHLLSILK